LGTAAGRMAAGRIPSHPYRAGFGIRTAIRNDSVMGSEGKNGTGVLHFPVADGIQYPLRTAL